MRWTGTIRPSSKGRYTLYAEGDNQIKVFVNGRLLLHKESTARREISKEIKMDNQPAQIVIEYIHTIGEPSLHIAWSGPDFGKQILTPENGSHIL